MTHPHAVAWAGVLLILGHPRLAGFLLVLAFI